MKGAREQAGDGLFLQRRRTRDQCTPGEAVEVALLKDVTQPEQLEQLLVCLVKTHCKFHGTWFIHICCQQWKCVVDLCESNSAFL